jgi:hypothetical protein
MSVVSAISAVTEAVASFLDPSKREPRVLRKAIEAAEQLLMILRKEGRYKDFTANRLRDHEIHFQKQFDQWRDGTP